MNVARSAASAPRGRAHLADADVCLLGTHRAILERVKSRLDDAKNATRRRAMGSRRRLAHERGDLLGGTPAPAVTRQRIFVVRREDYVYLVPFVEDEHTVFLKTIIPSRKATKQYLGKESDDEDGR